MSEGPSIDFDVQILACLCLCCRNQARYANKTDRSADVVGERGQAELAANIIQPSHQESTLVSTA